MQQTAGIQLSLFGKTLWERFLQMTGWILQPMLSAFTGAEVSVPSRGWAHAGMVRGGRADTAWRLLDAQYWGRTRPSHSGQQARVRRGGFCRSACRRSII